MKTKLLGALMVAVVLGMTPAHASYKRFYQDVKLPTQQVVEKQTVSAPAAAGTNQILSANAGNTSTAAVTVSSFLAQPDVARNLVITPGGTTADVAACTIVVSGTNIFGSAITENFDFTANQSAATTGSKAFKTVSSILWPANCEDSPFGATWSVGYGSKLGLKRCMASAVHFLAAGLSGVRESTFPTVAASATAVESNTAQLNSSLNGSDVQLFFMQNWGCSP